jgi:hypothetical protein
VPETSRKSETPGSSSSTRRIQNLIMDISVNAISFPSFPEFFSILPENEKNATRSRAPDKNLKNRSTF